MTVEWTRTFQQIPFPYFLIRASPYDTGDEKRPASTYLLPQYVPTPSGPMANKPSTPTTTKGQNKVATVMKEYSKGDLKSSSGQKVTNPAQAKAIALSEARKREGK